MRKIVAALALVGFCMSQPAHADLASRLSRYIGYKIIDVKTIVKYIDRDDNETGNAFKGCNFGRIIIFSDNTSLRCMSFDFTYEYRPEAIILSDGVGYIMIVGEDVYEMTNRR